MNAIIEKENIKIEDRLEIQEKEFKKIINEVKNQISNTQIEIFQNANMSLLKLYYNIGMVICNNSKWGNKFIDELACELKISFPNVKGFSVRNLKSMKKYYLICSKNEKVQTASAQIPWSHNMLILDKIKDNSKRIWYMNETAINGWSYDILGFQIKTLIFQGIMEIMLIFAVSLWKNMIWVLLSSFLKA